MKHGNEYKAVTSMKKDDRLTKKTIKALHTLVEGWDNGEAPRTVFFEGSGLKEGDKVSQGKPILGII
jgi:hypothetical protein